MNKNKINDEQVVMLLEVLKKRFLDNMNRHQNIEWNEIYNIINNDNNMLVTLFKMEETGGEPDVIVFKDSKYAYVDCSKESPIGRRSLCYDKEALEKRAKNKPDNNALDLAFEIGIDILDETQYKELQKYGEYDTKTSSWVKTPNEIRKLGGAIFCDFRYNNVFTYHNGADSYYSARGFRGILNLK